MRQAITGDLGVGLEAFVRFDREELTVSGCKCAECWWWKTQPAQRGFWRFRENRS